MERVASRMRAFGECGPVTAHPLSATSAARSRASEREGERESQPASRPGFHCALACRAPSERRPRSAGEARSANSRNIRVSEKLLRLYCCVFLQEEEEDAGVREGGNFDGEKV